MEFAIENVFSVIASTSSSLGMQYAPQMVAKQHESVAGMFGAAMLITGIFSGITFSVVFPIVVRSITW